MEHYLDKTLDWRQPVIADHFDDLTAWSAPFGLLLLAHVPMLSKGRVLDLGCGTGFPLTVLAGRMGPRVEFVGVDPWQAAAARVRRKLAAFGLKNAEILIGSADQVPLPDAHFDLAVSNLGINNFEHPENAFRETFRLLKPGAKLCLTTNLTGTFSVFYEVLLRELAGYGQENWIWALSRHIGHRKVTRQVEDLFTEAGFRVTKTVEDTQVLRFADGTAFLNAPLVTIGFMPTWKAVLPRALHRELFARVERELNALAAEAGELRLEVPVLYMEGEKPEAIPPTR